VVIIAILVILLIALALLLTRCPRRNPATTTSGSAATQVGSPASPRSTAPAVAATQSEEVLTPATLATEAQAPAGGILTVNWTGPDNPGDYLTIVREGAPATEYGNYRQTSEGRSLQLTAPLTPGRHEVRYVTGRSRTILGTAKITVVATEATLDAPAEVALGASLAVTWTGPDNAGDYITIVAKDAPDDHYGNYAVTAKGSPLTLTAPPESGDAEIRYVVAHGRRVLSRRAIRIVPAEVSISAAAEAVAGATIQVAWTGPDNPGDYITVVPDETPDGQYGNYTLTSGGSPLALLLPIMAGKAELRYMTGQGNKVLARRAISIVAAQVTLSAPAEGAAGTSVSIAWTGPNNAGDYITIVPMSTPDGQYAAYTLTSEGSPLTVTLPKEAGEAEIRYMTGQGNKVLARRPIKATQ
jgi:Ca-activated chloride channel family protein